MKESTPAIWLAPSVVATTFVMAEVVDRLQVNFWVLALCIYFAPVLICGPILGLLFLKDLFSSIAPPYLIEEKEPVVGGGGE